MQYVTYSFSGNEKIPATVRFGAGETPVWMQQLWEEGEFDTYIRNNGCGHCCVAMAANLHGVKITPYEEYLHCRKIWGPPDKSKRQEHFLAVAGVEKSLKALGIPATCYETAQQGTEKAADHIVQALNEGKQAIFISSPDSFPESPFSSGYHYVLAVGYDETGYIVIANSSLRACTTGVQLTDKETIRRALPTAGTASSVETWGVEPLEPGMGYIIVGE